MRIPSPLRCRARRGRGCRCRGSGPGSARSRAAAIAAPPRKAAWKPSVRALRWFEPVGRSVARWRRSRSSESTARPSAPPICCEVLIRPLARPASFSSTPETAAIVVVTKAKPRPAAANSEGPRMSVVKLPPTETRLNQSRPTTMKSRPGGEHRLVAELGHELGGDPGRGHDHQRQRQVGEPGVDRAVAEHLLHVEGDEEEHREERGADQQADHVGPGQGADAEDRERHQRLGGAQLDRDEGGEQRDRERDQADRLGRAPAGVVGVDQRVDEDRERRR